MRDENPELRQFFPAESTEGPEAVAELGALGGCMCMGNIFSKFAHRLSWVVVVLAVIATGLWFGMVANEDGWGSLGFIFTVAPMVGGIALFGIIANASLYDRKKQRRDLLSLWRCGVSCFVIVGETVMLLLVAGCDKPQSKTVQIADVTKASVVTLTAPADHPIVNGISLRFRGQLDGMATVSGTNVQTQKLTGDFDVKAGGDWYYTNCVLHYSPESVRSGTVTIEYEFWGSR